MHEMRFSKSSAKKPLHSSRHPPRPIGSFEQPGRYRILLRYLSLWGERCSPLALHTFCRGCQLSAIPSVVETCRRLKLPIRDYLAFILLGLADLPVNRVAKLTLTARAAQS